MPFLTSYFHIHYIFNVIKSHSCSLHSTNQTIFYISLHISTTMRNMLCKFLIIAVLVKSSCKHSLFLATRVKKDIPRQYLSNTSTGMSLNFYSIFPHQHFLHFPSPSRIASSSVICVALSGFMFPQ